MIALTQEQLESAGYSLKAAPDEAWRNYDEHNPIPGYFEFDWLSARHPDLYHKFALSSVGLMSELDTLVDLTGLEVVDIGAGTGRITMGAAKKAKRVIAIDIYESVATYGKKLVQQAGLENVMYVRGDNGILPIPSNSIDASICAWAAINYPEAYRVLKPGGYLIDLIPAPGSLCGELTATLADVYPEIITEIAPANRFDLSYPDSDIAIQDEKWNGVSVTPPVLVHDFTYVADYVDFVEAAAILGRQYGPKAKRYMLDRQKSTLSWRLRIVISRVKK
jgi:ubiquinone/menaquinone biosynthesis C-methylase UbiE